MHAKEYMVTHAEANQRLDKFLLKYLNKAPKSFVYKMLRKKNITLNGERAAGSEMLQNGDVVALYVSDATLGSCMEAKTLNPGAGALSVLYEDANVLVCDKPWGVLSQPDNAQHRDTMTDRVLLYLWQKGAYDPSAGASFTPALCNRLDRNTSGVVVCGKTLAAAQWLNRAFAEHKADKRYKAVVCGHITEAGTLAGFHRKDARRNQSVVSAAQTADAAPVETLYKPVRHGNGFTLVDITLVTGKSHQIRAHFQQLGCPVVGDVKYGDAKANALFRREAGVKSQLLHAERLTFTDTEGALGYLAGKTFTAPLPPVFTRALRLLD